MQLTAGRDLGHLTYCTNIHAGEPLDEVMASVPWRKRQFGSKILSAMHY